MPTIILPKPLGVQYQSPDRDITLLWRDFDTSLDIPKGLVICMDETDGRLLVMKDQMLSTHYRQVPDYNLQLDFEEDE